MAHHPRALCAMPSVAASSSAPCWASRHRPRRRSSAPATRPRATSPPPRCRRDLASCDISAATASSRPGDAPIASSRPGASSRRHRLQAPQVALARHRLRLFYAGRGALGMALGMALGKALGKALGTALRARAAARGDGPPPEGRPPPSCHSALGIGRRSDGHRVC